VHEGAAGRKYGAIGRKDREPANRTMSEGTRAKAIRTNERALKRQTVRRAKPDIADGASQAIRVEVNAIHKKSGIRDRKMAL
jgi:hypothetical protein